MIHNTNSDIPPSRTEIKFFYILLVKASENKLGWAYQLVMLSEAKPTPSLSSLPTFIFHLLSFLSRPVSSHPLPEFLLPNCSSFPLLTSQLQPTSYRINICISETSQSSCQLESTQPMSFDKKLIHSHNRLILLST